MWGFTGIEPVLKLPLRTVDSWQRDYLGSQPVYQKFPISENFRDSLCTYVHTYMELVHMYVCTHGNAVSLLTEMKNHETEKENA